MNIGFCNVQSIKPGTRSTKFDELKNILCSGHLDIIGFAETWLKPYVSSKSINIPGYNLFRNDRCGIRGGGVACYISSGLNAKILTSISEPGCEAIFLQIRTSVAMFIVGIVYLPRGDVDALERSISDIVTRYEHVLIVGDFNFDICRSCNFSNFRHFLTRCNLTVFHNDRPTHYNCSSDSVSLIDYSLVSCTSSVLRSNQFYFPAVNSYHAFLLIQYELPNNTASCYTTFRNYSAIDMNNLVEDVVNADFVSLYSTNDTNVQLSVLNTIFYELFNTHVPERVREVSRSRRAWFTPEIRAAIANRDLAYRAYMENKTARNKDIYNGYRAEARRMIRRAKREYGARLFGGINSPRDFWSRMRNAGASKSDSYSCDIDPDDLNVCFTSVSSSSSSSFSSPNYPDRDDDFNFRCVDEYEIFCAISSIKSNATGHDSIPVKFIKLIYPFISRHLLHFFNTIIMTGIFPANWKLAKVFPLRKKGTSGKECSDFRPICVLPALSKAFEIILKDQMCAYLESHSLVDSCQSGFRSHHSTTSLMIHVTDNIRRSLDRRNPGILAILDLSKAFNSVDHTILLNKLFSQFRFSHYSCVLIRSFLSDRSQFVISNGRSSGTRAIYYGVPQGSILGPLLFMLYVNDICECVHFSELGIYADDIQLYNSSNYSLGNCIRELDDDIGRISVWCYENNICLNVRKTNCVLFHGARDHSASITVQNSVVPCSTSVSCLGFEIDSGLSFTGHISSVCSKVNLTLRKLYSIDVILPIDVRHRLAQALLMPNIVYGLEVYSVFGLFI
ncbi:uncharacterized protein LOC142236775 [Haematobia irritans]|uniref:uncharacterized protein LOC142236775 n=1 Tax=Haematobia irritans TaxID=7368 RepID=UPI003F4F41CA